MSQVIASQADSEAGGTGAADSPDLILCRQTMRREASTEKKLKSKKELKGQIAKVNCVQTMYTGFYWNPRLSDWLELGAYGMLASKYNPLLNHASFRQRSIRVYRVLPCSKKSIAFIYRINYWVESYDGINQSTSAAKQPCRWANSLIVVSTDYLLGKSNHCFLSLLLGP